MSKIWFITGSSTGLGRAIVEAALKAGDQVVGTARDASTLDEFANAFPNDFLGLPLDVTSPAMWNTALEVALQAFGRIDVLVNNAGFGAVGSLEDTPLEVARQLFETNFFGAMNACQAILPVMREQGAGRIILISSIGARIATPGAGLYYASKAAVSSLAETLALEVAPFGIRVTAVEPGGMRTQFAEPTSFKILPSNPDYAHTVGATVTMMQSTEYYSYLSDPAGHAALILQVAGLGTSPTRLLAGQDAYAYGTQAMDRLIQSDKHWENLSCSASIK
ncbi:SDR family NAD(P)-dependent oxidoreductase [Lysobacter sp. P5_B9]